MNVNPVPPSPTPGRSGTGLTRRKLFWSLGLAIPLVSLSAGFALWKSRPARRPPDSGLALSSAVRHTRLDTRAAAAGELERAREECTAALAEVPDHASALIVLVCISLEAGELDAAQDVLARLGALAPGQPELRILEQLLANQRRAAPAGWGQAFLESWTELGRPDRQASVLLPESIPPALDEPALESAWTRAPSSRARLTLALLSPNPAEARARWVLQQVPQLDDSALLVAAFDLLRDKRLAVSVQQEAASVLRQRFAQLAGTSPRAMQLRLFHLLVGTGREAPLEPQELDALEAISVLPTWKEDSFTRPFLEARRCLEELAVPGSRGAAFAVAERALGHRGVLLLLWRAAATRERLSEDERRRMGRMLWLIGSRLTEQSSLLEHSVGTSLMASGAGSLLHGRNQREAFAREDEVHAAVMTSLRAALGRWPLRSLSEQLLESRARSEVTWLRAFMGKGALP
ncbi:tetratricopeptide repeat protein [Archangium gephyra]|uniref:tetratricopeptide repeat protein n=1 Tax=Archangium gephyra TaxID=48 RepID=UPI0035D3F06E